MRTGQQLTTNTVYHRVLNNASVFEKFFQKFFCWEISHKTAKNSHFIL